MYDVLAAQSNMAMLSRLPPLAAGPSVAASVRAAAPTLRLTSAVACKGLTKEFGVNRSKTLALRGVDVDVYDGQLTLLVGPSGCGKTTLISIIAGLLNPTQGSISVLGTELPKLSDRK